MDCVMSMSVCFLSLLMIDPGSGQRFKVMTTTSSVAVTWNESANFEVRIHSENETICKVRRGQHPRICVLIGLESSTRHDVSVISDDDWTELYSGIHFTKPLVPEFLEWIGSAREYIAVRWKYPSQRSAVEAYVLLLQRKANNLTEYQSVVRSTAPVTEHKIWLPSTYGIAYGTAFTLTVWSKYKTERSSPVMIDVYSAPRPVNKLREDTAGRSNTSAAIWWQPPQSGCVTGYRLVLTTRMMTVGQLLLPGNEFNQQNVTVGGTTTNYTFHRLTPSSFYQVSIWAIYHGAESSVERYTTIYTQPSPVKRLTVSYWTTDTVTVSWIHDDLYLAVGFDYVITATSLDHERSERVVSSATSAQIRYLRPGYKYTISICVRQASHPYASSVPVSATVQLKPDRVQYIKFNNITSSSVNVSWLPAQYQQDSYVIRYHGVYVKKYWSTPVISQANYVVLRNMFPGETYYIGVRARSGEETSNEITKTVTIEPLPPVRVGVDEKTVTERSAVIDIVYDRRLSANTQWYIEYELWSTGRKSYLTLPADVASVTLKSLTPGRLYTVRAYGRSTGGVQSSRSTDEVTFTTKPVFSSVLSPRCTSRSVTVTYQYTSDIYDGYVFTLYPDVIKKFNMKYDEAEMTYHNLLPGTLYTVMAQVYWGEVTSEGKNITILTKPEVSVRCGQAQNTSIELLLDDARGRVDEYMIQCNPGCAYPGTRIPGAKAGLTTYTVTDLDPDTSYEYLIRAIRIADLKKEESRPRTIYCSTIRDSNS